MALDTAPLSTRRRILLHVVLLAFFLASLALAQGLIAYQPRTVAGGAALPAGFERDKALAIAEGARVAYRGTLANQAERQFLLLRQRATGALLQSQAAGIYLRYGPATDVVVRDATLAGKPALDMVGGTSEAFVWVRAAIVERELVACVYAGEGLATTEDAAVFGALLAAALQAAP